MLSLSPKLSIPKMFLPYFSKERGPPVLRMQVMGLRGRRFYRLVACNQRDPRDGKHMEVIGSYAPQVKTGVKEIRLRFSRVKFWLGVGAEIRNTTRDLLAVSGLIPQPPPPYGRRTEGHYSKLREIYNQRQKMHDVAIDSFNKYGRPNSGRVGVYTR
jgi:small subunit ribosomal protein S16